MKVYEIIPGKLYIRQEFHKLATKEVALKELGIDTVFCMLRRADPDMEHMVSYFHRPLPDSSTMDVRYIQSIVDEVETCINNGQRVLVHCIAGKNRSGIISALMARRYYGFSGEDAVNHVRKHRPGALTNNYFVAFLNKLPRLSNVN